MHNLVKWQCASASIESRTATPHNFGMASKRKFNRTFLREWRKYRSKTLEQVAEVLHMSHGQLSRIERGEQPYNQEFLELLAELYRCDVPDLIMRRPGDDASMWSIWDQAREGERERIQAIAQTIVSMGQKNGTAG